MDIKLDKTRHLPCVFCIRLHCVFLLLIYSVRFKKIFINFRFLLCEALVNIKSREKHSYKNGWRLFNSDVCPMLRVILMWPTFKLRLVRSRILLNRSIHMVMTKNEYRITPNKRPPPNKRHPLFLRSKRKVWGFQENKYKNAKKEANFWFPFQKRPGRLLGIIR